MTKQKASLDSSFWINAYRAGLTADLLDYFLVRVCTEVAEEIRRPLAMGVESMDAVLFDALVKKRQIELEDADHRLTRFGPGEAMAIALAQERGYVLLIDDSRPHEYARANGIRCVTTVDLIVFMFDQGRCSYDIASQKIASTIGISPRLRQQATAVLDRLHSAGRGNR